MLPFHLTHRQLHEALHCLDGLDIFSTMIQTLGSATMQAHLYARPVAFAQPVALWRLAHGLETDTSGARVLCDKRTRSAFCKSVNPSVFYQDTLPAIFVLSGRIKFLLFRSRLVIRVTTLFGFRENKACVATGSSMRTAA
jgi:hypothetical protein